MMQPLFLFRERCLQWTLRDHMYTSVLYIYIRMYIIVVVVVGGKLGALDIKLKVTTVR